MPDDNPAPANDLFNHQLVGFVYLVNIQVEVIVDDIARSCYEDRRKYQQQHITAAYVSYFTNVAKHRVYNTIHEQQLGNCYKQQVGQTNKF